MIIKHLPAIFVLARPVLQKIEDAGFEAYFVGGCVRDTILGDSIHDIDIAPVLIHASSFLYNCWFFRSVSLASSTRSAFCRTKSW